MEGKSMRESSSSIFEGLESRLNERPIPHVSCSNSQSKSPSCQPYNGPQSAHTSGRTGHRLRQPSKAEAYRDSIGGRDFDGNHFKRLTMDCCPEEGLLPSIVDCSLVDTDLLTGVSPDRRTSSADETAVLNRC